MALWHGIFSQGTGGAPSEPPGPSVPVTPDGVWLESLFIDQADDTDVTVWEDASSAGYDMGLRGGDTPPKLRTDVTPSGAPAVRAPSAASRLEGATRWRLNDPDLGAGNVSNEPFTFFFVAACSLTDFAEVVTNSTDSAGWYVLYPTNANVLRWRYTSGSSAGQTAFGSGTNDGAFRVFTVRFDYDDPDVERVQFFVGKVKDAVSTGVSSVTVPDLPLRLFGMNASTGRSWAGDFCALLWFNSALSDTDREAIVDYLTDRYITAP